MAPLGVGGIHLMDNTMMNSRDAINLILHEIQRLERNKTDLTRNMQLLHKFILTIFCLYCRHLWIIHKSRRNELNSSVLRSRQILQSSQQDFIQMAISIGNNIQLQTPLRRLKFVEMNQEMNAKRIEQKLDLQFFRQIIRVYYVFDRLVQKLDSKIKEKMDKLDAEISALQQQYQISKSGPFIYLYVYLYILHLF